MAKSELGLGEGAIFNGRYRVRGLIKSGGMGAIYEVAHCVTGRPFALKVLLPHVVSGADFRERFRLEATATAKMQSDHVVGVVDAGLDESTGLPFLVMDLLDGEDLAARLRRRGPLGGHEVLGLFEQLRRVLDKTHAAGIVHRDLKPENLFLTERDDGSPCLKVLDFGIAKVVDASTFPRTTCGYGTPLYMPPEQIRGEGTIGPAADLYALGHVAFALMAGEAYWEPEARASSASFAFFQCVLKGTREPASVRAGRRGVVLPEEFDRWFARATELDPSERFETASELVEDLAEALRRSLPLARIDAPDDRAPEAAPADPGARGSGGPHEDRVRLSGTSTGPLAVNLRNEGKRVRAVLPAVAIALLVAAVGVVLSTRHPSRGAALAREPTASLEDTGATQQAPDEPAHRGPIESATGASSATAHDPSRLTESPFTSPGRGRAPRLEATPARAANPRLPPGERAPAATALPSADPTDTR